MSGCFRCLPITNAVFVCCIDTYTDIYATVGPALMICQLLAVLEIIHPLLRWVRTGVMMPILQVSQDINAVLL